MGIAVGLAVVILLAVTSIPQYHQIMTFVLRRLWLGGFGLFLSWACVAQSLSLDPIGAGPAVTITGGGGPPSSSVELFKNNTSVGSFPTTAYGQFNIPNINVAVGDAFYVSASQVWHFNTAGNSESWNGLVGDTVAVSGGTLRLTNSIGTDMSLTMYGDGLIRTLSRVLEVRLKFYGAATRTGSLVLQSAGPNGFAGGGDDGISPILNTLNLTPTATFQTLHWDLRVNHSGGTTCWGDGSRPISISFYIPNMAIGEAIEIDSIRLTELFDWSFDTTGDLAEWQGNSRTSLNASTPGVLRLESTSSGNIAMSRPFRNLGSGHFTHLTSRYRVVTASQPNLFHWNYFSNPAAYGTGGFQSPIPANGTFYDLDLNLVGAPLYGNGWGAGGAATLNFSQEAFSPFSASSPGEFAEVDYIRLSPATTCGPSPTVVASGLATPPIYYVSSSSGSDFNSGHSPSQSWATFTNLHDLILGPGSTVFLRRGDVWNQLQLRLAGKGAPGNPITLTAYGEGPSPLITGPNQTNAACIVWENPSHVYIDSMDCKDAKIGIYFRFSGGSIDGTGPMFNNSDVHVTTCHFQNMDEVWSAPDGSITVEQPYELSWGAGIWLGGSIPAPPGGPWPAESTPILDDFSVTHCGFEDCSTGLGLNFYYPGIYRSRFTNFHFEDSWVTGCENGSFALFYVDGGAARRVDTWRGGTGFYATGTTAGFIQHSRNFVIENCEFAGSKRNDTGNDGCGFDYEGNTENVWFINNVIRDNDGSGMLLINSIGGNTTFAMNSNTFWNNCRNPRESGQNNELRASSRNTGSFGNNGVYRGSANAMGTPAIYNDALRWTSYAGGTTTRTSTTYAGVGGRPLQWDFTGSVEGWGNASQWNGFSSSAGSLAGTSSGIDPYAESPATWVNTRERRAVRVRMSQTAGTFAQVFFQLETDTTFSQSKSVLFPIVADGIMRDYLVDMGHCQAYRGVVTKWRLDPTDSAGSFMTIDGFAAEANPCLTSVTPVSAHELDLRFNQPMLPSGGVFHTDNFTLDGHGRGTSAIHPSSVSLIATTNGPVYRLAWSSGNMNGAKAILTAANALNARGLPLWTGNQITFGTVNGIFASRPPSITSTLFSGMSVALSGIQGPPGGLYRLISTTNPAAPIKVWQPVLTNFFGANGSFEDILPVNAAEPQRYYRLLTP